MIQMTYRLTAARNYLILSPLSTHKMIATIVAAIVEYREQEWDDGENANPLM